MSSPYINRFLQPDTIIPDQSNPQEWNRYSYVTNNPIIKNDPTGHFGDFILDIVFIAADVAFIMKDGWTPMNTAALAVDILCAIVPFATGGGAIMRGGQLALQAGASVPKAIRYGQAVEKGAQLAMSSSTEEHHIATNKNYKSGPKWSEKFKNDIFDPAGMDLNDPANKVDLPNHKGPHPQSYHQWVYDRLSGAIKGLGGQDKIKNALTSELNNIGDELLNDPGLLNGPKPKGR